MATHGADGCDCHSQTVGEFLLSRGIQQVDAQQLAAGERLHNICSAQKAQQQEARETKWESTVKVIEERWVHMQETINSVSSTYERESKETLKHMQDFKNEVMENIARTERSNNEERCLLGEEMRKMQIQLMEVKDTEIYGLRMRVESLQGKLSEAEERCSETERCLNTYTAELESLRTILAAEEKEKKEINETLEHERSRNASIIAKLKEECYILNDAIKEASVSVESQKKQHSITVKALNETLASVSKEGDQYKDEIERLLTQNDEAEQLLISKTQEVNIMKVTHESAIMDLKGQVGDLNSHLASCRAENSSVKDRLEKCQKKYSELTSEHDALQVALEEARKSQQAMAAEHEATVTALRQEHAAAVAAMNEKSEMLMKTEMALAREQGVNTELVRQNSQCEAAMQQKETAFEREIEDLKKSLAQAVRGMEAAKAGEKAAAEECEKVRREKVAAEEALAHCGSEGDERMGALQRQLGERETVIAELKREVERCVQMIEEARCGAEDAGRRQVESEKKFNELKTYTDEVVQAAKKYEEQTQVFENLNTDLGAEVKGLRLELRDLKEERDALKEIVTMGRYDAMDSMMRDRPCVSEEEAKEMRKEIEDGKIAGDILNRAIEYMYTNCIKAQEVLEGYLACLPAVPGFEQIDYFKLEEVHGKYTALLRDTVRAHVEGRRREEVSPPAPKAPPPNPLSSVNKEREKVKEEIRYEKPSSVHHVPETTGLGVDFGPAGGTLSLLGATPIDPSPSTFLTTTHNASTMTVPPPEKPKPRVPARPSPTPLPTRIPLPSPVTKPKCIKKPSVRPLKKASPPPPPQNPQNLVFFSGRYSVPEVIVSPRR